MAGFQKHLVLIVCLGVAGSTVEAANTATGISDVSLSAIGGMTGRYLDGEGRGIDGAVVTVAKGDLIVARTTTDPSGAYVIADLRPGVYQMTLGQQTQTVRVWNALSAPPASRRLLTIIRSDSIIRGQLGLIGGSVGSTVGAVGGTVGAVAGGAGVVQSMDAQDDAEEAMKEAAKLREMMKKIASP